MKDKKINDKYRSIKLFEYFIEFLKIFGQENYGESAEVNWYAVFNYCQSYGLFDFNDELTDIIYTEDPTEFRDKCFSLLEKNILEGYPVWRLFKMSDWLMNQLEKQLHEFEVEKDKKYFYKTTRCFRCKYYSEHISAIHRKTHYSYHAQDSNGYIKPEYNTLDYNLFHFRNCEKRTAILEEKIADMKAKGQYVSHDFERYYTFKYRRFNLGTGWSRDNKNWKLNPWTLRRCPLFEENPNMTYEEFIKKFAEMPRITEDDNEQ